MKNFHKNGLIISLIITAVMIVMFVGSIVTDEHKLAEIYFLYIMIGCIFSLHFAANYIDYLKEQ